MDVLGVVVPEDKWGTGEKKNAKFAKESPRETVRNSVDGAEWAVGNVEGEGTLYLEWRVLIWIG